MNEILEQRGDLRVRLVVDQDAGNPREEYDHLANVVTVPSREYLPVDKDGGPLADAWTELTNRYRWSDAVEIFERYARIYHGAVTLYDTPPRDANAVWYLMPEVAQETTDPEALLKAERDEYRAWAEGSVYGYIIERRTKWNRADGTPGEMETWEHEDSLWGLLGYEYAEQTAREDFAGYVRDAQS